MNSLAGPHDRMDPTKGRQTLEPKKRERTATLTPPPAIDRSAKVIVFCYHRFEDNPRDTLALPPAEFRAQMKQLKDDGIAVVAMKDFLTWRRGEKSIPPKSAVITIDDGYVSGYAVAWPILKEFGYPFTMFIYTNYAFVKDIRGRVPGPEVCRACDIAIF